MQRDIWLDRKMTSANLLPPHVKCCRRRIGSMSLLPNNKKKIILIKYPLDIFEKMSCLVYKEQEDKDI